MGRGGELVRGFKLLPGDFEATYQGVFFRRLLVSSTPYINQKATVYTDMETHHITP